MHERIQEEFHIQNIEATRQTLNEWFNAIQLVQDRRRQELDNATQIRRSAEIHMTTEKGFILFSSTNQPFFRLDLLQVAEALRVLCITTRKIRTVLWYWLYWSTNSATNNMPSFAQYQDLNFSYPLINHDLASLFSSDIHREKSLNFFHEHNKENQYQE